MDLRDEILALALADRDIEMARQRVARQKTIVEELERDGHDVTIARAIAKTMREALAALEAHRELILDRIEHLKRWGEREKDV
jgi:hypothetical protein